MSAPRTGLRSELAYLVRDERSRELAAREGDGLCVQLLWDAIADAVSVEIEDRRAGKGFHVAVGRRRALDAFYHPFAYAA